MRKQWNEFVPDQPFEYSILEDELGDACRDDLRTGTVFTVFTILAIFVSLMGLIYQDLPGINPVRVKNPYQIKTVLQSGDIDRTFGSTYLSLHQKLTGQIQ